MLAMLGVFACRATIVPRLSLEEMAARSETIVSGQVTRVWTAWDSPHRFIWTHTEILVSNVTKGNRSGKLVVSEPGSARAPIPRCRALAGPHKANHKPDS